jgi:tetratricopeptide (TPR) repeat protein
LLAELAETARVSGDEETRRLVSFGLYNRGTARALEAMRQPTDGRAEGLLQARADLTQATTFNLGLVQAFLNLGLVLLHLAESDTPPVGNRSQFLGEAREQFEHAAVLAPALSDPFEGLANTHIAIARSSTDKSARLANLSEASSLYWRAAFNDRKDHRLLNNWGVVLKDIADATEGSSAQMAYQEACDKLRRAAAVEPSSPNAHYNWALTLHGWAQRSSPDEAPGLLAQASQKYMVAIRLAPDRFEASYNRGVVFMDLQRTSGLAKDVRRDMLRQACEMFRLSTEVNPDLYEGFYNWGNAMVIRYSIAADRCDTTDLASAVSELTVATKLRPDSGEARNNLVWCN